MPGSIRRASTLLLFLAVAMTVVVTADVANIGHLVLPISFFSQGSTGQQQGQTGDDDNQDDSFHSVPRGVGANQTRIGDLFVFARILRNQ